MKIKKGWGLRTYGGGTSGTMRLMPPSPLKGVAPYSGFRFPVICSSMRYSPGARWGALVSSALSTSSPSKGTAILSGELRSRYGVPLGE